MIARTYALTHMQMLNYVYVCAFEHVYKRMCVLMGCWVGMDAWRRDRGWYLLVSIGKSHVECTDPSPIP